MLVVVADSDDREGQRVGVGGDDVGGHRGQPVHDGLGPDLVEAQTDEQDDQHEPGVSGDQRVWKLIRVVG